jgi:hypothetical protein
MSITNMKHSTVLLLSGCALITGIITYALYNELLIVQFPTKKNSFVTTPISTVEKKKFTLYYWHQTAWRTEEKELLQTTDARKTLSYVLTAWLNMIEEERIVHKKITVQSVMLDNTGHELYISFDHSFLPKHNATHDKLLLIEGMLKTIHACNPDIQYVIFLVHHQPLQDMHLDFSQPWPINGFLSAEKSSRV